MPCKAEKEFAFPRFDILMVHSLKAYNIAGLSGSRATIPLFLTPKSPTQSHFTRSRPSSLATL